MITDKTAAREILSDYESELEDEGRQARKIKGGICMRNMRIQKSPLSVEGGSVVHRRVCFGQETVCEQSNFTRYTTGKSKPEE